jgi:hypothetical protein
MIDSLDDVAVREPDRQVAQVAVHPGGDGRLAVERGGRRRAGFHHELASGEGDVKLVGRHGGSSAVDGSAVDGSAVRTPDSFVASDSHPDATEASPLPRASIPARAAGQDGVTVTSEP